MRCDLLTSAIFPGFSGRLVNQSSSRLSSARFHEAATAPTFIDLLPAAGCPVIAPSPVAPFLCRKSRRFAPYIPPLSIFPPVPLRPCGKVSSAEEPICLRCQPRGLCRAPMCLSRQLFLSIGSMRLILFVKKPPSEVSRMIPGCRRKPR
jgi:hypothetical protein